MAMRVNGVDMTVAQYRAREIAEYVVEHANSANIVHGIDLLWLIGKLLPGDGMSGALMIDSDMRKRIFAGNFQGAVMDLLKVYAQSKTCKTLIEGVQVPDRADQSVCLEVVDFEAPLSATMSVLVDAAAPAPKRRRCDDGSTEHMVA